MCDFCDSIPTLDDYKKISPYDRYNKIVYSNHVNKYYLWIENDDWYYSGIKERIYYCPVCGRELNQNKNICSVENSIKNNKRYKNMTDKEKIKELEKENEELKKKLVEREKSSDNYSSGWDFHWDGRGDYLEAQRCFYGDFS